MIEKKTFNMPMFGEMIAWVLTPSNFDKEKESLPVIVFLHGSGESHSPEQPLQVGLGELFVPDQDYHGIRAITIYPFCPHKYFWEHIHVPVFEMVNQIVDEYNGDRKRISITGLSMGGYGTWDQLCFHSDFYSCGAPICGGGTVWKAGAIKCPVRVFHGDKDDSVPMEESIKMVNEMKEHGGNVELTIFPGVGHGSWNPAYKKTDLVEWLVSQHKD